LASSQSASDLPETAKESSQDTSKDQDAGGVVQRVSKSWHKTCAVVFFKEAAVRDWFVACEPGDVHPAVTFIGPHTDTLKRPHPLSAFIAWEKSTELGEDHLAIVIEDAHAEWLEAASESNQRRNTFDLSDYITASKSSRKARNGTHAPSRVTASPSPKLQEEEESGEPPIVEKQDAPTNSLQEELPSIAPQTQEPSNVVPSHTPTINEVPNEEGIPEAPKSHIETWDFAGHVGGGGNKDTSWGWMANGGGTWGSSVWEDTNQQKPFSNMNSSFFEQSQQSTSKQETSSLWSNFPQASQPSQAANGSLQQELRFPSPSFDSFRAGQFQQTQAPIGQADVSRLIPTIDSVDRTLRSVTLASSPIRQQLSLNQPLTVTDQQMPPSALPSVHSNSLFPSLSLFSSSSLSEIPHYTSMSFGRQLDELGSDNNELLTNQNESRFSQLEAGNVIGREEPDVAELFPFLFPN